MPCLQANLGHTGARVLGHFQNPQALLGRGRRYVRFVISAPRTPKVSPDSTGLPMPSLPQVRFRLRLPARVDVLRHPATPGLAS